MPPEPDILTLPNKQVDLEAIAAACAAPVQKLITDFKAEAAKGEEERDENLLAKIASQVDEKLLAWQQEHEKAERKYSVPGSEGGDDGRRKGQKFSIAKMGLAIARKDWDRHAPFEKEVCGAVLKALSTDVDTAGGYLVPEEQMTTLIELLRAETVALEMGATQITASKPFPIKIPKLTADTTATWINEAASIPVSQPTFGQISLTPRKLAARVILSSEVIEHSAPTADAIVNESIAAQIGLGLDYAVLRGTGMAQPLGILSLASNTTNWSTGTAPKWYERLIDTLNQLDLDNALRGKLGFVMHPTQRYNIQVDSGHRGAAGDDAGSDPTVAHRLLTEAPINMLVGYPFKTTTQLAATGSSLIFGNWADVLVARWSNLVIRASDTTSDAFETDQVHIRGILRADTNVRHGESFCVMTNCP